MTEVFLKFCIENKLNAEQNSPQWKAVINDGNTVISAGAGTGKTTVLSFRFLRIVAEHKAKPSEILTITFTRKATAEMKERIYTLMQSAHAKGLITDDDLDDYSNCTISTVDAFCSEIVRKNCIHQGIPRDFDMISAFQTKEIIEEIVEEILNEKEYADVLLNYLSIDKLKEICKDFSEKYQNISEETDFDKNRISMVSYLEFIKKEYAGRIIKEIEKCVPELEIKEQRKETYYAIRNYLETDTDDSFEKTEQLFKSLTYPRADKNLRDRIKVMFENYYSIAKKALGNLSLATAMGNFIEDFQQRLSRRKRTQGLLSFNDIMKLTLKILTEDKKQREQYKKAFKYIMIDEFQDNNDDYRKLLFLLSEEYGKCSDGIPLRNNLEKEKIFLVGDQKQSIYKFRGADVSVFKALSTSICGEGPIELSKNWRSEPYIINFCNDVFSKVMKNEDSELYEADFSPLEVKSEETIKDGKITIIRSDKKDDTDAEACAVADFIEEICSPQSTHKVPDKNNELRPVKYGEICVLMTTGSRQARLESELNSRSIPFSVTPPKTLMTEAIANDFQTALMAVLFPEDKLTLASFLKSPFCSLKDKELKTAVEQLQNNDFSDSRIKEASILLSGLKKVLSQKGLSAAVSYLWNEGGYRSFILSSPQNRSYSQHFDWLYTIACEFESQRKNAVDFADYIRQFREGELKKADDETIFSEKQESVQIMTVHKSKGLAFKVVIVYGTDLKSTSSFFTANNSNSHGFFSYRFMPKEDSDGNMTLENPIHILDKDSDRKMSDAETKRVFYVAATRPKYHLVFSVSNTKVSKPDSIHSIWDYLVEGLNIEPETGDGVYNRNGYDFLVKTYEFHEKAQQIPRKKISPCIEVNETPSCLEKKAVTSLEENSKTPGGEKLAALESDGIIDKYSFNTGFGTLVHSLIEEAVTEQKRPQDTFPEKADYEERKIILNDAVRLAEGFVKGNYFQKLKEEGFEFFCEKPFLLVMKNLNTVAEGRIDMLAISREKVIIIDFKTDRFKQEDKHREQLETYKLALEKMPRFKDKEILTDVVYLREKMK